MMVFLVFFCFLGCLLAIVAFFLFSDSTLNLFLCEKFGISEDEYFTDKVVWVIGASSGIGEAISMRLARHRCRLVLSARRKDRLELVAQSCIGKRLPLLYSTEITFSMSHRFAPMLSQLVCF
ncbi:unnamed protein product [Toxocara canis]|uniref:Dehydrogenase/reductase SDR family member 7 n=1 Tax=Toxocara canis TaxID=6265 RepID=A0A183UUP4_TOXCA|nr:unnamed protein product [Toxocara canis]